MPQPRITPTLPSDWDEETLDALGAFPGGLKFVLNGWEEEGKAVRGTHMLGSMARYPALAKAFLTFNNHVATNSTLTVRDRELLILRIGWLAGAEYEFVMHVILGRRAGLSDAEIERVQTGPEADGWNPQDATLLRAADELHKQSRISDQTWQQLSLSYGEKQLMDIIYLVGCYEIVAMVTNSFNTPLEPGVEALDAATRARMGK